MKESRQKSKSYGMCFAFSLPSVLCPLYSQFYFAMQDPTQDLSLPLSRTLRGLWQVVEGRA